MQSTKATIAARKSASSRPGHVLAPVKEVVAHPERGIDSLRNGVIAVQAAGHSNPNSRAALGVAG